VHWVRQIVETERQLVSIFWLIFSGLSYMSRLGRWMQPLPWIWFRHFTLLVCFGEPKTEVVGTSCSLYLTASKQLYSSMRLFLLTSFGCWMARLTRLWYETKFCRKIKFGIRCQTHTWVHSCVWFILR